MEEFQLATTKASAYFPFGFHISAKAWQRYRVSDLLTRDDPRSARPSTRAIRTLADRLNETRASGAEGKPPARAGELMLAGVLNEVLRHLIDMYCEQEQPGVMMQALDHTRRLRVEDVVEGTLSAFADRFRPQRVHEGKQTFEEFLRQALETEGICSGVAREIVLLALANENPALRAYRDLFDDSELKRETPYTTFMEALEGYFESQPPLSAMGQKLFELLRAPIKASPDSLEGQLRFILDHWRGVLPADLWKELTFVQDIYREETRPRFFGPGSAPVLRFGRGTTLPDSDATYPEPERFSMDLDWMSNVVLIAKSTYVWLDQLSKKHSRDIHRLDQIPEEELDQLARWGITGLWLIGVWERSTASQRIKQMTGNPEAMASAYSLYDYVIAHDLGGPEGYQVLRDRAWQRGIRLASDMVPNHTGIYSKWVAEHPDWYVQVQHPPYPAYRFNGADLSPDDRMGIQIEDGYWSKSDAAVVFKRWDKATGETRYIYHGNDGTNMPWNDTAQLNYLLPEVREAVIQTILHVARQFPIIRFDAAMTLAKRHFQRLWFPKPGDGGAVPSRSEHGMSKGEFDALMPEEFWREVVDRVAQEAPDTLLLAEAFWLMEGYFVRTLGMHRVYNSAFMNMLKMERNGEYRTTVKNVLEFSPQVLKRFVNFMNNPDELTAVEQFGKGDKYFGAAMTMLTMPGLPMIGHGQIEGYTEKYGMEYRRAMWEEKPDEDLIRRHEQELFPLAHKRYLFSGVDHFALYDFHTPHGHVDENVFAYSNRAGGERAVILYNNAYGTTAGWIRNSTQINIGEGGNDSFISRSLGEALAIRAEDDRYYLFRDYRDGLEYIRNGRRLADEGLYVNLRGYQYHAFLDWSEVQDTDGNWRKLAEELQGGGVQDIRALYHEMVAFPMAKAFRRTVTGDMIRTLAGALAGETPVEESAGPALERMREFLGQVAQHLGRPFDIEAVVREFRSDLQILQGFEERLTEAELGEGPTAYLRSHLPAEDAEPIWFWRIPVAWAVLDSVNEVARTSSYDAHTEFCVDDWDLLPAVRNAFNELGYDWQAAQLGAQLIRILVNYRSVLEAGAGHPRALPVHRLLDDEGVRAFLQVNRYEDVSYFNKEQLEAMIYWLFFVNTAHLLGSRSAGDEARVSEIFARYQRALEILEAAEESGYRLEEFLARLE